jgi:transcription elongation GreA/GreB family factor
MTTITIKHFDALAYVKKAKELGANEELAEYQARQMEQAIDIAIATIKEEIALKDLATKRDLESTKNQIILWVAGLFIASGLLQHFFK